MNQSIIVLCGVPFSGKSRLAQQLNNKLQLRIVSYDNDVYAIHKHEVPPGTTPAKEYEVIQAIAHKYIGNLLSAGGSIIYDDLCLEKDDRRKLERVANEHGAKYVLVFLDTPESVIQLRREANLKALTRSHVSDEKLKFDLSLLERPGTDEDPIVVFPDTPLEEVVNRIYDKL